jgi:hypothetical protein
MSRRTQRRRAEASYGPELGTTYLLHFRDPETGQPARYQHAGHYTGWTRDLAARLEAHARGTGARLVEVITKAGLGFTLARTWPETTRDREDLIKHAGGGRRYCPECGVKPSQEPAVMLPERRRCLYELERDGTWLDGTPLPDNIPTWQPPAAHRKDAEMFGRDRRAAAREQAEREARAQGEADALFAEADRLDDLAGQPYGYRQQITAERAARIRAQLGEDLARDALAQASPQAAEAWGPAPEFEGAERDAEIDRLAEIFPEPAPEAHDAPAPPDYYRSAPGSAEHRDAYRHLFAAADGIGFSHPDPGLSYEIDNADELARERYQEEVAERHYREMYGDQDAGEQADREYEEEAERRQLAEEDAAADTRAPDHVYGAPECAEADPETAHCGWAAAVPQDAGRFPLPRILEPGQASPVLAPMAATLADGTPHADPFLAGRGWQAQGGVYVRGPQAQAEAEAV